MENSDIHRNQPCPCGSGKKYKRCCAPKEKKQSGDSWLSKNVMKWVGGVAVAVLAVYGIARYNPSGSSSNFRRSQFGEIQRIPYYTDADLKVVDFSGLTGKQKKSVMDKANKAQCTCGCAMNLAECIVTDITCPLRNSHISRVQDLVEDESG